MKTIPDNLIVIAEEPVFLHRFLAMNKYEVVGDLETGYAVRFHKKYAYPISKEEMISNLRNGANKLPFSYLEDFIKEKTELLGWLQYYEGQNIEEGEYVVCHGVSKRARKNKTAWYSPALKCFTRINEKSKPMKNVLMFMPLPQVPVVV